MKIVIAGNHNQYVNYLRQNSLSPHEAHYVCRHEHLLGFQNVEVVRVGEWWLNPCAHDEYLQIISAPNANRWNQKSPPK